MARRLTDDPPLGALDTRGAPRRPTLEVAPPIARRRERKATDWGLVGVLAGLAVAAGGMVWFGTLRYEASQGAAIGPQAISARPQTVVPGQEGAAPSVPVPSGLGTAPPAAPAAARTAAPTTTVDAGKAPLPPSVPYAPSGGLMGSDPVTAKSVGAAPTPKAVPGGDRPVQVTNDVEKLKAKALGQLKVAPGSKQP
jgi:hypothetical protein